MRSATNDGSSRRLSADQRVDGGPALSVEDRAHRAFRLVARREDFAHRYQRAGAHQVDVLADREAEGDLAAAELGVRVELGEPLFDPERRAGAARGKEGVNELVIRGAVFDRRRRVDEHDAALVPSDEQPSDLRFLALHERVEVRLRVAAAAEDHDARARCGRMRLRLQLMKGGRQRLEIAGDLTRAVVVRGADDVESRGDDPKPPLALGWKGDRRRDAPDLPRAGDTDFTGGLKTSCA